MTVYVGPPYNRAMSVRQIENELAHVQKKLARRDDPSYPITETAIARWEEAEDALWQARGGSLIGSVHGGPSVLATDDLTCIFREGGCPEIITQAESFAGTPPGACPTCSAKNRQQTDVIPKGSDEE